MKDPPVSPVWVCRDKRTGALLGVVARDCPTEYAAKERASRLWGFPPDWIGASERKR